MKIKRLCCSRRDFLRSGLALAPTAAIASSAFLRSAFAGTPGQTRNLVLVELFGGNDGLNTLVPWGSSAYYGEFRPNIGIPESSVLKVAGQQVGFHPALAKLKAHFDAGRLAVVHGVSYPNPSFSHEFSQKIWHSGTPSGASEGWLARYLNLFPVPQFPAAGEIAYNLSNLTQGIEGFVPAFESASDLVFPTDEYHFPEDADNRKNAFSAIVNALAVGGGAMNKIADTSKGLVSLIDTLSTIPDVNHVGQYPDDYFSDLLKTIVKVMSADVGMRFFHVGIDGFDTHSDQNTDSYHADLLRTTSDGVAALWDDLVALGIAQDTLIVIFSEFGRTVYENGSRGTDHGTVNPVIVLGNSLNGGFVNAHPAVDPSLLDPNHSELQIAADFRDVFGTVLEKWLNESQATVDGVFLGHPVQDLGFIP